LSAGEFFGHADLLSDSASTVAIRARNKSVETLMIPRADFIRVMNDSPRTAEALTQIVQKHLAAHKIANYSAS
jgi:CRP-like cAMP-binding protein